MLTDKSHREIWDEQFQVHRISSENNPLLDKAACGIHFLC